MPVALPSVDVGAVEEDDDETELTVDRSALLEARNAAQNQTFVRTERARRPLLGRSPDAAAQRPLPGVRLGIPPQEPFTMPRPPSGCCACRPATS